MDDSSLWLSAVVESSDDAIVSKTLQGVITSWNSAAERLFGYSAAEAIGRSVSMLVPADRADEEPRILERIGRGEQVHHFETVRLRKDGSSVDVSVTVSPVRDPCGRIVGASKIARDISGRKQAEARLRAQLARLHMLDQITRAIGEHQDIRSIHQVALRSVEERMPLDFACICALDESGDHLEVAHIGTRSSALAHELALAEHGHLSIDANGLARCVGGKLVYEPDTHALTFPFPRRLASAGLGAVVLAPLWLDGRVVGLLVAARRPPASFCSTDCEFLQQLSTHVSLAAWHAHLHASLRQAYDDLRASQAAALRHERLRALGQMASGVAHDIKNLIFPASVFAKDLLATERGLTPQGRDSLATVVRTLADVNATVERLREFYRPREPEVPSARVALNAVVPQVLALARPRCAQMAAAGAKIDLRAELGEQVPDALGSEAEIREALVNLVFNALDAMPEGGTLVVRTGGYAVDAAGAPVVAAEVTVQDDGIGMDEETRQCCMDPFFTTKGEAGTGMGLAMVYGSVQRHNAEILVDSAPGQGTTFTVRFPPVRPAPPPARVSRPVARARQALRILVIDDDPLVLETLLNMLRASGHAPTPASDGRAGIDALERELARERCFDVVLTDLGMPELDGHAVARAVKERAPATPVVLLTGWGEGLERGSGPHPAIDAVMSKPPRLSDLNDVFARVTAGPGVAAR